MIQILGRCNIDDSHIRFNNDSKLVSCDGGNGYCYPNDVVGEGKLQKVFWNYEISFFFFNQCYNYA